MTIAELGDFIQQVGLPSAIAIGLLWYILVRLNGKIERMVGAIEGLAGIVKSIDDGALDELNAVKSESAATAQAAEHTVEHLGKVVGKLEAIDMKIDIIEKHVT